MEHLSIGYKENKFMICDNKKISKILLMRLEHIGDVLLILPVINNLRKAFPDATIDIAIGSWAKEAVRLNCMINDIIVYNHPYFDRKDSSRGVQKVIDALRFIWSIRKKRYDVIFDFRGNLCTLIFTYLSGAKRKIGFDIGGRGGVLTDKVSFDPRLHQIDNNMKLVKILGAPGSVESLSLNETDHDVSQVNELLRRTETDPMKPLIALYLSAAWLPRRWEILKFIELANWILDKSDCMLLIIGSKGDEYDFDVFYEGIGDKNKERVINLVGKTTLMQLAIVLKKVRLCIGVDSGPMHLAALLGIQVIALMGPGEYPRFAPYGSKNIVIRKEMECSPCQQKTGMRSCKFGINKCMQGISVDDVKVKVEQAFGKMGIK
jgi:ADP-heptose:LPS heptosyltransferase